MRSILWTFALSFLLLFLGICELVAQQEEDPLPPPPDFSNEPPPGGGVPPSPPPDFSNEPPPPPPDFSNEPPPGGGVPPPSPPDFSNEPPPEGGVPLPPGTDIPPPPGTGTSPSSGGGPVAGSLSPAQAWEQEVFPLLQPFRYDGEGRRNPFKPYQQVQPGEAEFGEGAGPSIPLGKWDIEQIQLIGILWNSTHPKAMFRSPDNKYFILEKDERIGRNNGYIGVIREMEVVVVEPVSVRGESSFITRIMRLKKK